MAEPTAQTRAIIARIRPAVEALRQENSDLRAENARLVAAQDTLRLQMLVERATGTAAVPDSEYAAGIKTLLDQLKIEVNLPAPIVNVEVAAPAVTVEAPVTVQPAEVSPTPITVAAPVVTVQAPEISLPAPLVHVMPAEPASQSDLEITLPDGRKARVTRK